MFLFKVCMHVLNTCTLSRPDTSRPPSAKTNGSDPPAEVAEGWENVAILKREEATENHIQLDR